MSKKTPYFNKEWLQDANFKLWLQKVPTNRTKQNVNYTKSNRIIKYENFGFEKPYEVYKT